MTDGDTGVDIKRGHIFCRRGVNVYQCVKDNAWLGPVSPVIPWELDL